MPWLSVVVLDPNPWIVGERSTPQVREAVGIANLDQADRHPERDRDAGDHVQRRDRSAQKQTGDLFTVSVSSCPKPAAVTPPILIGKIPVQSTSVIGLKIPPGTAEASSAASNKKK